MEYGHKNKREGLYLESILDKALALNTNLEKRAWYCNTREVLSMS